MINTLKKFYRKIRTVAQNARIVQHGFSVLEKEGKTPDTSYWAMRKLFVETRGKSNDVISRLIKKKQYTGLSMQGVLGLHSPAELNAAVNDIRQNGFHIFDAKLPDHITDAIVEYAKVTPTVFRKIAGTDNKSPDITTSSEVIFNEKNPVSPVYQFSFQRIVENEELQKLIFDQSLLSFAQAYLNTRPVMDLIAMWWSVPFEGKGKSEAAQMYHFDLDRIKFIKFFFYLTDVDAETGPHCYVKASHKRLLPALQKDGRLTDEEVTQAYGKENLLELCGKKGTIMAVDTRGLHKGKDLTRDKRLIFQIEFANSMFGQTYPPCKKPPLSADLEEKYKTYFDTYSHTIA